MLVQKIKTIFIKYIYEFCVSYQEYLIIAFLGVLSFVVFSINLFHEQIWYEEALSIMYKASSFKVMLHDSLNNCTTMTGPFYYFILKLIPVFQKDKIVLRIFSVLCGSGLVIVTYIYIKKIVSKKTALFAALLLVFNPLIISLSQEISVYILTTLIIAISIFNLYLAIIENRIKYWIVFGISTLVAIYTHYYSVIIIFIGLIFFIIYFVKNTKTNKPVKKVLLSLSITTGLILIGIIPIVPVIVKHFQNISMLHFTEEMNIGILYKIFGYFYTSKFFYDFFQFISYKYIAFFIIAFILFYLFNSIDFKKEFKISYGLFVISFFLPVIIMIVFSLFFTSIFIYKSVFLFFPFFCIIISYSFTLFKSKLISYTLLALFCIVNFPNVFMIYKYNLNGPPLQTYEYLDAYNKKNEKFVVLDDYMFITLGYYMGNPDNLFYYPDQNYRISYMSTYQKEQILTTEELINILKGNSLTWTVITPSSQERIKSLVQNIEGVTIQERPLVTYSFRYSWIKTRILRVINETTLVSQ